MKKNNKGFTMIEIIGAVIIMGILVGLIVPNVSRMLRQFRIDYYDKLEQTTNESGKDFFADNQIYKPDGLLKSQYVNVSTLISQKYADSLLDYKGKVCSLGDKESYTIAIHMGNGEYEYKTCIKCANDDYSSDQNGTYCDPAWLTNDNLGYDYGASGDVVYFYYGSTRESIREKLLRTLNIVKYNNNGAELERVIISETKEDGVLPNNIDIVENKPVLDSDNKKEYELQYGNSVDNNIETLTGIIYKHKAPTVTMTAGGSSYSSGNWTRHNVIIKLNKNDDFFKQTGTTISEYQMKVNDGEWKRISCNMTANNEDGTYSCSFNVSTSSNTSLISTYRFRIVTNEGNISDESIDYTVKIDKIPPKIDENIIKSEATITIDEEGNETVDPSEVIFEAWDNESGFYRIVVETNGYIKRYSRDYITLNYEEPVIVTAYSVDDAGNTSRNIVVNLTGTTIDNRIPDEKEQCTITYHANGGNVSPSSEMVDCGDVIYFPIPTKDGYQCEGWYTSDSGGTFLALAAGPYTLNTDIDAYVHWTTEYVEPVKYTLTLNPNKGQILGVAGSTTINNVEANTSVDLSKYTPERTGYNFSEWCNKSNGSNCVGKSSYTVTQSRTLYAKWVPYSYTIKYNANGGTGSVGDQTCAYNEDCKLKTNIFEKSNYAFGGWEYNGITYPEEYNIKSILASLNDGTTITLNAIWIEKQLTGKEICNFFKDSENDKAMFGSSKGALTGNYGMWYPNFNFQDYYECIGGCELECGYDRVCVGELCNKYGYLGWTATQIKEDIKNTYGVACSDPVKYWCQCGHVCGSSGF